MPRVLQRVHRSAAESIDRFFPPLPDRCLKRGHSHEERKLVNFLIAVRLCAHEGRISRCGVMTEPDCSGAQGMLLY
jgi:hypothetical protein